MRDGHMQKLGVSLRNTLRRKSSAGLRDRQVKSMRRDGYGLGNGLKKMPPRKRRTRKGTLDKYRRKLRTIRAKREKADARGPHGDHDIVYDIMRKKVPRRAAALIATHVKAMDARTQLESLPREAIKLQQKEYAAIIKDHVSARRDPNVTYKKLRTNRKQQARREAQLSQIHKNIYGYREGNRLSPVLEDWSDYLSTEE